MSQPVTLPDQSTDNMSPNATDALRKGHSAVNFIETATVPENYFYDFDTDTAYSVSDVISNPENQDASEIFFVGDLSPIFGLGPGDLSFNPEIDFLILEDTSFDSISFKVLRDATFRQGGTYNVIGVEDVTFVTETTSDQYYRIGNVEYDSVSESYSFDYALL